MVIDIDGRQYRIFSFPDGVMVALSEQQAAIAARRNGVLGRDRHDAFVRHRCTVTMSRCSRRSIMMDGVGHDAARIERQVYRFNFFFGLEHNCIHRRQVTFPFRKFVFGC